MRPQHARQLIVLTLSLTSLFIVAICAEPYLVALASTPFLAFDQQSIQINEHAGQANILVRRNQPFDQPQDAFVSLTPETATFTDYKYPAGLRDTNFRIEAFSFIIKLGLQSDGKILVGESNNKSVRLNTDGTIDPTFVASTMVTLGNAMIVQPDDKILGNGLPFYNGPPARLNADGSLDTTFIPEPNALWPLALQHDGKIIVKTSLPNEIDRIRPDGIERLQPNGMLDPTFAIDTSLFTGAVSAVAVQADGKILVALRMRIPNSGMTYCSLMRLNTDGALDSSFQTSWLALNDNIANITVQPDGKILVGGSFYNSDGTLSTLLRLTPTGALDPQFHIPERIKDWALEDLKLQPDGKIIIAGVFDCYTPEGSMDSICDHVLRLQADGSEDQTFTSYPLEDTAYTLALLKDGRILAGGGFWYFNEQAEPFEYLVCLFGDPHVHWDAGDTSPKTVALPIIDDTLPEGDEHLTLNLWAQDAHGSGSYQGSASLTIVDDDVLHITSAPPQPAMYGYSYSYTITSDRVNTSYALANGVLPPGFVLASNGVIEGTPTQTGNYTATISATDALAPVLTTTLSITVDRAPLTIAADSITRTAGLVNPPLTASYTGFINGDNIESLDTPLVLSTTATENSPPGVYSIVASGASDANYTITTMNGTLTITPSIAPAPQPRIFVPLVEFQGVNHS